MKNKIIIIILVIVAVLWLYEHTEVIVHTRDYEKKVECLIGKESGWWKIRRECRPLKVTCINL